MLLVTVYTHRGISIQINQPSQPSEIGYTIAHPQFDGQRFNLVQEAIDAIDSQLYHDN